MTAKEKAKELMETFDINGIHIQYVETNALSCVDEILKVLPDKTIYEHAKIGYWKEVKEEIEAL